VVRIEGKDYTLFHKGKAKVRFVLGEFYWRVKAGEVVEVEDYIAPPEILSSEKSPDEIVWSIGEYIQSETIRMAFQITQPMPFPFGVAPNQPSALRAIAPTLLRAWMAFMTILFSVQIASAWLSKNEEVYSGTFTYLENDPNKQKVSPSFELKNRQSNVQFEFVSRVENSWLEMDASLVNDQTGDSYDLDLGVEYYTGVDSDGYWTEGSRLAQTTLSSIPEGHYHLNFQVTGPDRSNPGSSIPMVEQPYAITVTRGVTQWSNFFLFTVLLSVFPLWTWWRDRSFEKARWSTSDFSPYWSGLDSISDWDDD
jgi:hypothetical protein